MLVDAHPASSAVANNNAIVSRPGFIMVIFVQRLNKIKFAVAPFAEFAGRFRALGGIPALAGFQARPYFL
jgi:hypothetical protein